jgi:hypothetical protein
MGLKSSTTTKIRTPSKSGICPEICSRVRRACIYVEIYLGLLTPRNQGLHHPSITQFRQEQVIMRFTLIFSNIFLAGAHAISPIVGAGNAKAIPDSYIVVLKKELSVAAVKSHLRQTDEILGLTKKSDFGLGGFKGYHVRASKSVVERLAENDEASLV